MTNDQNALDALRAAFPAVAIDADAVIGDAAASWVDHEAFSDVIDGRRWTELGVADLEPYREAVYFVTAAGLGQLAPALLMACVESYPACDLLPRFVAGALALDAEGRARWTPSQRDAIARALVALERLSREDDAGPSAARALELWRSELVTTAA